MQQFGFRYHIELVKLLACCTMGKNVYTEIKCHSLLPLDDIVVMVSHPDCIPEVQPLTASPFLFSRIQSTLKIEFSLNVFNTAVLL